MAFLDMAYQGFRRRHRRGRCGDRQVRRRGLDFFVSTSFSKSFSLYGERVGALSVACESRTGRPRAQPAQARDPHQLLQPADARRHRGRHRAEPRRRCARCGSRSWPACVRIKQMREALQRSSRPPASSRISATSRARRACSATPASLRSRCSACAANSASTASIRPHLRGGAQQQEHRRGRRGDRQGVLIGIAVTLATRRGAICAPFAFGLGFPPLS